MRRDHQRDSQLAIEFVETLVHFSRRMRVEIAGWLVRQQQLGPQHDRARHRDALLLAAGQFRGRRLSLSPRPTISSISVARRIASASSIRPISAGIITFSSAVKSASR